MVGSQKESSLPGRKQLEMLLGIFCEKDETEKI